MANDTLPMDDMFQACYQVLRRKLIPIHYADLTELALNDLGLTRQDVNWSRQIEDVREKMLEKGRHETFYTGKPDCLAGLTWWFPGSQFRLANPTDGIWIPGNATLGAKGAFEALMRDPYMKIKKFVSSSCEKCGYPWLSLRLRTPLAKSRASGFVIEKHVADWFFRNWPEFYLPPDNEGQWKRFCDHDFKLKVGDTIFGVDITGRKLNGKYGNPGQGKRKVDFHLACEIRGADVLWISVFTGKNYNQEIFPDINGICPERMIVWLNCIQAGLDYDAIKLAAIGDVQNA